MVLTTPCRMLQISNIFFFPRKNLLVIVIAVGRPQPPFYQKVFSLYNSFYSPQHSWGCHCAEAATTQKSLKNRSFQGFLELLGGFELPVSSLPHKIMIFIIFSCGLWAFLFRTNCFPALLKRKISGYSNSVCAVCVVKFMRGFGAAVLM